MMRARIVSEGAKDLVTFAVLLALSTALAAGGQLWLGPEGRIPVEMTADGVVARSTGLSVLWLCPLLILVTWGLYAPGAVWWSSRRARALREEGKEDVARGMAALRSVFRIYLTLPSALLVGLQLYSLARAAGLARPLGLDRESVVRLFFVMFGLVAAYLGDRWPKAAHGPDGWLDARRRRKAARFFGLVFVTGGIAIVAAAVATPFDRLTQVTTAVSAVMVAAPIAHAAALGMAGRRDGRAS